MSPDPIGPIAPIEPAGDEQRRGEAGDGDEGDELRWHGLVAAVRGTACGSVEGLLGPASVTWMVDREMALLFGGGRALLLQLSHPAVASGVEQHSDVRRDPVERARRTFDRVYRIVFADLDGAIDSAQKVHARHRTVRGPLIAVADTANGGAPPSAAQRYRANDPSLLLWVHATLIDTAMLVFERIVRPLSVAERELFYEESKRVGMLFGIPAEALPPTLPAFQDYFRAMLEGGALVVTDEAREQARFLASQPPSSLLAAAGMPGMGKLVKVLEGRLAKKGMSGLSEVVAAGWLPPALREAFGFSWSPKKERALEALVAGIRAGYPLLPKLVRHHPAYRQAMARLRAVKAHGA